MTIFLVFPFTRLVHVWSAPIWYLGRKGYQVVRTTRSVTARPKAAVAVPQAATAPAPIWVPQPQPAAGDD